MKWLRACCLAGRWRGAGTYRQYGQDGQEQQAAEDEGVAGKQLGAVPVILREPGPVAEPVVQGGVGVGWRPDHAERKVPQVLWLTPQAARPRTVQHGNPGRQ